MKCRVLILCLTLFFISGKILYRIPMHADHVLGQTFHSNLNYVQNYLRQNADYLFLGSNVKVKRESVKSKGQ